MGPQKLTPGAKLVRFNADYSRDTERVTVTPETWTYKPTPRGLGASYREPWVIRRNDRLGRSKLVRVSTANIAVMPQTRESAVEQFRKVQRRCALRLRRTADKWLADAARHDAIAEFEVTPVG